MRALVLVAVLCVVTVVAARAYAADTLIACPQPGFDAGTTAIVSVSPNSQFMVSCNRQVQYKACKVASQCDAGPFDAPIAPGQVDLCMPSGSPVVSLAVNDGGTAFCCVYQVTPKTVCQINTP